MKKWLIAVVALVAAAVLFFILIMTGVLADKDEAVKIAVAGAHSGDLASYGLPTVNAVKMVTDAYNEKGGILGRPIELIVEDDVCSPDTATNTAAKVVGAGAVAVIGHICSGATKSALGVYIDAGIPVISPSATNPALTQSGDYPNFFRTIAPDDAQAATVAQFIANNLGLSSVAVVHDKQDYGKGFADFSVKSLEFLGVEILLYEGITVGAPDYTAVLNKAAASGAEGLLYGGYHPEASKLVQQMAQIGLDIPFISDDGVKDDSFIDLAGEYAEDVYASGPMDTSGNPLNQAAAAAHRKIYDEDHGTFFMNGYAAITALLEAVEAAGSTESDAVMDELRSNYFDTAIGSITFDEKGDAVGAGFTVYQVQNGVYVEL